MVQLRASSHQRHSLADAARQAQGHLEAPFGPLETLEHDQLADRRCALAPGVLAVFRSQVSATAGLPADEAPWSIGDQQLPKRRRHVTLGRQQCSRSHRHCLR